MLPDGNLLYMISIVQEWITVYVPEPGVGHEVGLELVEVHVQGPVEPQGGRDGGDDLKTVVFTVYITAWDSIL